MSQLLFSFRILCRGGCWCLLENNSYVWQVNLGHIFVFLSVLFLASKFGDGEWVITGNLFWKRPISHLKASNKRGNSCEYEWEGDENGMKMIRSPYHTTIIISSSFYSPCHATNATQNFFISKTWDALHYGENHRYSLPFPSFCQFGLESLHKFHNLLFKSSKNVGKKRMSWYKAKKWLWRVRGTSFMRKRCEWFRLNPILMHQT